MGALVTTIGCLQGKTAELLVKLPFELVDFRVNTDFGLNKPVIVAAYFTPNVSSAYRINAKRRVGSIALVA